MPTFRVIYFSENHLDHDPGELPREIEGILAVSRRNNRRLDVTGALLYDDLWFVQALEGERDVVWSIFLKILADRRHEKVVLVDARETERRLFGDWSMAFAARTAATAAILDRFSVRGRLSPRQMTAPDLLELLGAAAATAPASAEALL